MGRAAALVHEVEAAAAARGQLPSTGNLANIWPAPAADQSCEQLEPAGIQEVLYERIVDDLLYLHPKYLTSKLLLYCQHDTARICSSVEAPLNFLFSQAN